MHNGKLYIRAIKKKDGERDFTSARLTTHNRAAWKYGYFEIKVKMPNGMGAWPAIWMMQEYNNEKIKWPRGGEIDIVEHCSRLENLLLFSLHSERHNCLQQAIMHVCRYVKNFMFMECDGKKILFHFMLTDG